MSLQDYLDSFPSPIRALTRSVGPGRRFPYPMEHSNWRDEQRSWVQTATLFNQSWHMHDLYISGPDALRLLSDTSTNSYTNFGGGQAKQYLAVNEDGYVIGDTILIGLTDELFSLNGNPASMNWLTYHAETGGYDVTVELEPGHRITEGPIPKRMYRYELEGPNAQKILEKAVGSPITPIKFFRMGEFDIAGHRVQVLSHTMAAAPGAENTGLELFGPEEHHQAFLEAILAAGEEFGLVRGGAIAYGSTLAESGWVGSPVPAVYTGESMRGYREWLQTPSVESDGVTLTGSYRPDSVEGYYSTPWDLGYGHMIRFDHDFIGRDALERMKGGPNGRKVFLRWNPEDAARIVTGSELGAPEQYRPTDPYKLGMLRDEVRAGDRVIGMTHFHAYTVNVGWVSVASLPEEDSPEGAEVEIVWGDHDGAADNPFVPTHVRTTIRARVHHSSPAER